MIFDREKFKTLVLYVIWRTGGARDFGLTKLNKALWFAEARSFEACGTALTGESYFRQKFGPVAMHLDEVLQELRDGQNVQMWIEPHFDFEVTRYTTLAPPDMSTFSGPELGFVDWWIRQVSGAHPPAPALARVLDYGWQIAKVGEAVPLHALLAKRIRPPQEGDELNWARQAATLHETT